VLGLAGVTDLMSRRRDAALERDIAAATVIPTSWTVSIAGTAYLCVKDALSPPVAPGYRCAPTSS